MLLCSLVVLACSGRAGEDGSQLGAREPVSEREDEAVPAAERPAVVFAPEGKAEVRVVVEVARTARQIQRGLMYREHLPPDAGMLFLFRRPKVQSFWMKNTLIPLDMIFVSPEMKVVGVVENAEPRTLISRSVGVPSQYVVEVNGGWASAHGVRAGTPVRFENVRPLGPEDGDYD